MRSFSAASGASTSIVAEKSPRSNAAKPRDSVGR
jgi:hypothetical protein